MPADHGVDLVVDQRIAVERHRIQRRTGIVEQQRLLKLLVAAGIKSRGNLANFIAMKVCGAIVLAGLAWMALELGHLFANVMLIRLAMLGAALMFGWRLPDFILGHMIKRLIEAT